MFDAKAMVDRIPGAQAFCSRQPGYKREDARKYPFDSSSPGKGRWTAADSFTACPGSPGMNGMA